MPKMKEESTGLVKGYFPQEIQSVVDLRTLELFRTEFIDKGMKEHREDLIYKTLLAGERRKIKTPGLFVFFSCKIVEVRLRIEITLHRFPERVEKSLERGISG